MSALVCLLPVRGPCARVMVRQDLRFSDAGDALLVGRPCARWFTSVMLIANLRQHEAYISVMLAMFSSLFACRSLAYICHVDRQLALKQSLRCRAHLRVGRQLASKKTCVAVMSRLF